jgi:perosamine synthetase
VSEELAVNGGTPVRTEPFPHGKDIGEEELQLVTEVIRSGHLNMRGGTMVDRLEQEFAGHYGVAHCTTSTSGTSAIHVAIGAIEPQPCDEIITAPITDMGTVIPILAQNCIPVFADVDPWTFNITPESIEQRVTDRTVAVIPVHLFGNPCDMDGILEVAGRHNLRVIEDSSQAYGTMYDGKRAGTIGDLGTFSLQQSKHITTGDGGLTITDDPDLGGKAKLFSNKGWPQYSAEGARDYVFFGMCYRMTELTAAVALAQLRKLDRITAARNWAGDSLTERIQGIPGVHPPKVQEKGLHTYWLYGLRIKREELGMTPGDFARACGAEGLGCGVGYIGKPIFLYELIRNRRVYGGTLCPFDCRNYGSGHEVTYEEGYCPETEAALSEMVTTHVNEFWTERDVEDAASIIRKVAASA